MTYVSQFASCFAVSGLTEKDKLAKAVDVHMQAYLSKPGLSVSYLFHEAYEIISGREHVIA
jgi:hypothetical protein